MRYDSLAAKSYKACLLTTGQALSYSMVLTDDRSTSECSFHNALAKGVFMMAQFIHCALR